MEVDNRFCDWCRGRLYLFCLKVNIQLKGAEKSNHDFLVPVKMVGVGVISVVSQFAAEVQFLRVLQELI